MHDVATDDRLAVSKAEAARLLDVQPKTVQRLIAEGELRAILVRGSRRIELEELRRYVARQRDDR